MTPVWGFGVLPYTVSNSRLVLSLPRPHPTYLMGDDVRELGWEIARTSRDRSEGRRKGRRDGKRSNNQTEWKSACWLVSPKDPWNGNPVHTWLGDLCGD